MNKELLLTLLIFGVAVWAEVLSCNSCGVECESACGTRHFRTCCFNYLKKKRNSLSDPLPLAMDPSLRLELQLVNSRNRYYYDTRFPSNIENQPPMHIPKRFNMSQLNGL